MSTVQYTYTLYSIQGVNRFNEDKENKITGNKTGVSLLIASSQTKHRFFKCFLSAPFPNCSGIVLFSKNLAVSCGFH